jgi:death-on-curing protein
MRAYNPDADMFSLAAQYAGGIIQNHPFIDGNKRTSSYVALLFLRLNGVEGVHVRLPDLFKAVLDLATHKIDEEGFATVLRSATRLTPG